MKDTSRDRRLEWVTTTLALVSIAVIAATFERGALAFRSDPSQGLSGRGELASGSDIAWQCPALLHDWWVMGPLVVAVIALGIVVGFRSHAPAHHAAFAGVVSVVLVVACPVPLPGLPAGIPATPIPFTWRQVIAAFLAFGVLLQVASGLWLWNHLRGDSRRSGSGSGIEFEEPDLAEIAAVAGSAADAIEEPAADENQVYRAWREMTALLDVPDADSSTPGEFARAAIDAGMDPDDVRQLTTLFRDVRYGAKDADEREARAVAVLRRIEREYGGGGE